MEVRQTRAGRAYNALVLTSADGAALTIVDPEFTERLSPSVVTSYQRRLGIKTRFASLPEPPSDSTTFKKNDDKDDGP